MLCSDCQSSTLTHPHTHIPAEPFPPVRPRCPECGRRTGAPPEWILQDSRLASLLLSFSFILFSYLL